MSEDFSNPYKAWDLSGRIFHWVNFLCVITLNILALIMLNKDALGISGTKHLPRKPVNQ